VTAYTVTSCQSCGPGEAKK